MSVNDPAGHATVPGNSLMGDLREIVHDAIAYRDLLGQLTLRDIKIRYKQSVMGFAWAVLMPTLIVFAGIMLYQ